MKQSGFSRLFLIGSCFTLSLKANDLIEDKSPDGKFALRIDKDGDWEAAIIEVRTKKKVADLETYSSYAKESAAPRGAAKHNKQ